MIYFPNAKINLGLNIVSKRPDGYHNLETIFYPIDIKDAIEVIVKKDLKKDAFVPHGIPIDGVGENNLVMRALCLMRQHYTFPLLEVHLLKKIPFGAGIGGGSADAAFMLMLLNNMFSLGASKDELASYAVELGADCPFFIYNTPMYAEGVGEQLTPIDLCLKNYKIALIKPHIFVSTKDAFSKVHPATPPINLKEIIKQPVEEWKGIMVNDFEQSVFALHPEIREIKEKLYQMGAIYASMSGSGASVYAIFKALPLMLHEEFEQCFVWHQQ